MVIYQSRKQDYTGIGLLKHQDTIITDTIAKADVITDYFSSVVTHEDSSDIPSMSGHPYPSTYLTNSNSRRGSSSIITKYSDTQS